MLISRHSASYNSAYVLSMMPEGEIIESSHHLLQQTSCCSHAIVRYRVSAKANNGLMPKTTGNTSAKAAILILGEECQHSNQKAASQLEILKRAE